MNEHLNTIGDVERFAAQHGITLTPTDKARITSAQEAERKRLDAIATEDGQATWADRWNAFYPRLLDAVVSAGDTIITLSKTLITALGVPVVLVLLMIVEHHRVVEGILLFDPNPSFASFAAWALVGFNLALEFLIHHIELKEGYQEDRRRRWSLRIWSRNMAYRLGTSQQWQEQELSPAARYKSMLRLVTFTILALALVGSMKTVIASTDGTWLEAIGTILTESSLLLMLTWIGGLLFAAAAVTGAQVLSRYVAIRAVEIAHTMEVRQRATTDPHAIDVERAGALAALAIVNAKLEKKNPAPSPVVASSNGKGHDPDPLALPVEVKTGD